MQTVLRASASATACTAGTAGTTAQRACTALESARSNRSRESGSRPTVFDLGPSVALAANTRISYGAVLHRIDCRDVGIYDRIDRP